jgi:lysyl-tRNA synthetase class I
MSKELEEFDITEHLWDFQREFICEKDEAFVARIIRKIKEAMLFAHKSGKEQASEHLLQWVKEWCEKYPERKGQMTNGKSFKQGEMSADALAEALEKYIKGE